MINRKDGFYWVRRQGGGWIIAEWDSRDNLWFLHGNEEYYRDTDFVEINAAQIELSTQNDCVQQSTKIVGEGEGALRDALKPFAFMVMDDDGFESTQALWECIYRDRVQDWFAYEDFDAARQVLKKT